MFVPWWKTSSISWMYVYSFEVRELFFGRGVNFIYFFFILEFSVVRDRMKKGIKIG